MNQIIVDNEKYINKEQVHRTFVAELARHYSVNRSCNAAIQLAHQGLEIIKKYDPSFDVYDRVTKSELFITLEKNIQETNQNIQTVLRLVESVDSTMVNTIVGEAQALADIIITRQANAGLPPITSLLDEHLDKAITKAVSEWFTL